MTLSGSNTYIGPTTIGGGTLAIAGSGVLGGGNYAGNISIGSSAALNYAGNFAQTFSGVISGSGGLTQSANSVLTLAGSNTFAGTATISAGTMQVPSGQFAPANLYVGSGGTGSLLQSGGQVSGNLDIGTYAGSSGTYALNGGTLTGAGTFIVGDSGSGTFVQIGGIVSDQNDLTIGNSSSGSGTYQLQGGLLATATEHVGISRNGSFSQSGGTNSLNTKLYVYPGASYSLSGGWLNTPSEDVGGSFIQSGGTNSMSDRIKLGDNPGTSGSYSLGGSNGAPVLTAPTEYIGYSGSGAFTQSSGTNIVASLVLGSQVGSGGIYNLAGGLLQTGSLSQGGGAASFNFSGGTLQALSTFSANLPIQIGSGTASIDTQGNSVTLSASLSGSGSRQELGSGSTILTASHTYTGAAAIAAGTRQIGNSGVFSPNWLAAGINSGAPAAIALSGSGVVTTDSLFVGLNSGAAATFTQSGGLLSASGTTYNAASGVGIVVGSVLGSSGVEHHGRHYLQRAPIMVWGGSGDHGQPDQRHAHRHQRRLDHARTGQRCGWHVHAKRRSGHGAQLRTVFRLRQRGHG